VSPGRHAPVAAPSSLRIGYPARGRTSPAFECPALTLAPQLMVPAFRVDRFADGVTRMLREGPIPEGQSWPDTLHVRMFSDVTDEEIALERGELDVAVFWPGEIPKRLRNDARWGTVLGLRSRGVVAAIGPDFAASQSQVPRAAPDLAEFNLEMFGGDLLPWRELGPARARAESISASPRTAAPDRFTVDPAMPGHVALERFLNHGAVPPPLQNPHTVRIGYLDVALAERDTLQAAWRSEGVVPLFAIRCPVLCVPQRRAWVESVGASVFVDLATCGAPERRP